MGEDRVPGAPGPAAYQVDRVVDASSLPLSSEPPPGLHWLKVLAAVDGALSGERARRDQFRRDYVVRGRLLSWRVYWRWQSGPVIGEFGPVGGPHLTRRAAQAQASLLATTYQRALDV